MSNGPARLMAGAQIAAPQGAADYCMRRPQECASASADELRGHLPATGAARFQPASYSARAAAQTQVFEAIMAARMANAEPALGVRQERMTNPALMAELAAVNTAVNRAIRPATDNEAYGVEEYWARPLLSGTSGQVRGDCEDYALEKRARLIALGWAPETLAITIAIAPRVGLHAVLVVQTDQGDLVLDNLYSAPQALAALPYTWLSRQTGPDLGHWAVARFEGRASAYAPRNVSSPEDLFAAMMDERMRQNARARIEMVAFAPLAPIEQQGAQLAPVALPAALSLRAKPARPAALSAPAPVPALRPWRVREEDLCAPR
ncbi:MAG: transglutaminase-like cysteine peptidase [Hyphomonadaceae bacterium]|nr:transglutaminase-like cysteine peptidase [Hyphomonadaceae bacterium]